MKSSQQNTPTTTETVPVKKKGALTRGGESMEEALFGFGCGFLYGVTSPLVGHPFDTIKTKMQAQNTYMSAKQGMFSTFATVVRNEGFFALYKGLLPPLIGSSIFRSIQFGVYNFFYTHFEKDFPNSIWIKEIPYTGGLEPRVIAGGVIAATCRTAIEAPLELIKVRRQVGQPWDVKSLFNGFSVTWVRTTGLMVTFFILLDTLSRHAAELLNKPVVGPFIKGGVVSTLSWWLIWPFETLKNQVQANTEGPKTLGKRFVWVVQNHGAKSLFRGIVPGSARSLIANGASMLVFQSCQDARQHWLEAHKKPQ